MNPETRNTLTNVLLFGAIPYLTYLWFSRRREGNQNSIQVAKCDPCYCWHVLEINRNNLSVDKTDVLGKGAFGIVYKGQLNGNEVAIKSLNDGNIYGIEKDKFTYEISYMIKIGEHPNIIKYLGCNTGNEPMFAILEYASGGDIGSFLRKKTPESSPEVLLSYAIQVANGMTHLQVKKIVHRDLAARNILVVTTNGSNIIMKIADFGFSINIENIDINQKLEEYYVNFLKCRILNKGYPVNWMAPETLVEIRQYSLKSDVWSYGVLLWEIYSHGRFIPERFSYDQLKRGRRLDKPRDCSPFVYELMKSCWEWEPINRPEITILIYDFKRLV